MRFVTEFWTFLKERKRWWLFPIIIALVLAGFIIALAGSTAAGPFIYSLF